MDEIKRILKFFEDFSLEEELYWSIHSSSYPNGIDLRWQRNIAGRGWQLRTQADRSWHHFDVTTFAEGCRQAGIDLTELKSTLSQTALQQASYAQLMFQEASAVFGQKTLSKVSAARNAFLNKLTKVIDSSSQPTRQDASKPRPARNLRVIEGLASKL